MYIQKLNWYTQFYILSKKQGASNGYGDAGGWGSTGDDTEGNGSQLKRTITLSIFTLVCHQEHRPKKVSSNTHFLSK